MSIQFRNELFEHGDFIRGLEKQLLDEIAWRCPEPESAPRTVNGKTLAPREVFLHQAELAQRFGVTPDAIRKAARRLEDHKIMVRKWFTSSSGTRWTAKPGHATVYVFPTVAELEAARPRYESERQRKSQGHKAKKWPDDGPGIVGARQQAASANPDPSTGRSENLEIVEWPDRRPGSGQTNVWANGQTTVLPTNTMANTAGHLSIHSGDRISNDSEATEDPPESTSPSLPPKKWRHPDYGSVRVGSDGLPRPYGRVARLRWEKDGAPVLEPPRREGASPTGRGAA
ncbi:hypothetical protein [Pauljensenia sp. UMB0895]|uniref:hypothetical protein n=1 Tax=Pauljensenia sp. UMB0895 TaxID=3046319 RepID=UPI00254F2F4A|nr:hypothetical protein [Pauljensenia sp. UMB0895]MDK7338776.1 hypothetical protein [Pauljensenia sp. UMB0895]